jgi:tRNA(Arg) A34 adenosine deaminase TadA
MDETLPIRAGVTRRHVVAGALGAVTLPLAVPAFGRGVEAPATEADLGFMRLALEEAAQGDEPYYFGAVIVKDGDILSRGRNLWRQQQDVTAHAEMVAIRRCFAAHGLEKIKGATLYATGECCAMCMGATLWSGISRVVFGASIAQLATKFGQIMITDAEIAAKTPFTDIMLTGGVLAKESLALFK